MVVDEGAALVSSMSRIEIEREYLIVLRNKFTIRSKRKQKTGLRFF